MAGESPDRSKQRESSEEPTSGSAGPVPEARTGASETRDPRLAVAREDTKRSSGSAGSGSGGGVDTATRVLSVREPEQEAETSGEDDAGASAAPETSEAAGGDDAVPAAGNDGRLRDAVAAWVATADERAAVNARLEDERDPEEPAGDGGKDATAGTAASGDGASRADSDTDTDSGADAASGTDAGSASDDADADAPADSDEPSAPGGNTDSEPGSGSGSDGDADSVDTDPESAPGSDADAPSGSDAPSAPGSDTDSGSATDAGSAAVSDSNSVPDSGSDADAPPAPDSAPGRDSASDPASDSGSDAGSASGGDKEPAADAGPATDAGSAAVSGSDSGSDSGPAPERKAGSTPGPETKPGPKPRPEPDPGSDVKPDSGRDGDDDRGTDGGRGTDGTDGDDGDRGDSAPQVDQPTAVFKAPKLDKPAVDQPTTMLKLGDAASAAGKAGQQGDAPARSEGEAERTSKFVALRNPDDPANRKPPQAAQATEAPKAPSSGPKPPQAPRTGVTAARPHVGPDRTTQQPLPPKPPLDLLAELTNTPPPPETPLRTTVRRVKIWTPLVALLVIILGVVQSMRPLPAPTLDLTAQDSFTFDGGKPQIPWPESGQAALDVQGIGSFGSSGDQKPVPIASVAKVMTAYVILRDHPLKSGAEGPKIKIDQAAEDQSDAGDESTVNVYAGDSISQREALKAVLIASANNVARLLARWDAGSEKAFVEKMNAAAKDLGMTNTTYTDPSGLNNTTVSTAVDQVKLAKAAMKSPAFREVAAMMSYNDYKGVNHGNWNHLVGHNGVVGIKTGTTTSALGNLVFAAKKEVGGETRTIVGAVVRQPDVGGGILDAALDASDELIRAAQDTLQSSTILKKGSVVGYVDDGLGGRTPVVATKDVKAVGWGGLTVKLTFDADELPHAAKAGTKVGTLTVGDGGTSGAVKVPVALRDDLVEPGLSDKLTRLG
ncbi:D-alanyl-D-alanine carboxypeptidase [Streptomyces sp. NRRL WC-3753]|nr:D-alanyl-D-alanine carboxypeptidase [Streptomyces sp. NRRL WC-3753]